MVGWIDVLTRTELTGEMIKQFEWSQKNKGLEWFACVFIRQRGCKAGALRIACARLGPSANEGQGWCLANRVRSAGAERQRGGARLGPCK